MSKTTEYKLADIFPVSMSGEWGSDPFDEGNALVLRAADFTKDCKLRATIGAPRNIPQLKLGNRVLKDGDILIEKSGGSPDQPVGRVAFFDRGEDKEVYVHSNFLQLLRVAEGFDKKFCYYLMAFLYSKGLVFRYQQQTTGIINLKLENYLKEKVSVPSVSVQRQIQEILSTIDRTITHTETLIEKYQQIKAGLMHDLFTRGIGADGKLRPPHDKAPELYRESSIGWIPKEWSLTDIDSIKESIVDGPFGSNLKTEHYVSDPGVRIVRLQNIQSTKYNDKDKAFVSNRHANSLLRNKVISNDILIAGLGEERYPVGRSCLYPEGLPPALNKADCFRLRCIEKEMINNFAMYFLNTSTARTQVEKYNQGVTRSRINTGNIRKVTIPKPKLDEQFLICERLDELARRIDVEIDVKHKLELQKSGLMHDLLTGTVRVNSDPV